MTDTTHAKKRPTPIFIFVALAVVCGCLLHANAKPATAPANTAGAAQAKAFQPLDLTDPEKPTLFQIGYSHLDTEWRWGYPQVIREFLPNTVHDNVALFQKYPHYVFNFTGAGRYKLIQDYHPDDFAQIRAAVAAGNWWPNGVAWEECDVNVPSAESLVRQFLLGHEYFMREFGTESGEFMLPDCFGFPASLPSVLAHCGIRGFSTQKLSWGSAAGIPFNVGEWIGTDGNSVIAALNAGAYVAPVKEDPSYNPAWLKRITDNGEKSGVFADFIYMGTGDRGGSPGESSVALLEQGLASGGPVRVVSARADAMFLSITDAQKKGLPKYTGDLLLTEHSAGSITSQACMKHWNRENELLADAAERASVAAWLLGAAPWPREKLNRAWQLMLRSQFHDTLPGTSLPKVYEYAWNDEIICLNTFAEILTHAVGAVASGLDTAAPAAISDSPPGTIVPLVIHNPLSILREDIVEATVKFFDPYNAIPRVLVFDGNGKPVPTQTLSIDSSGYHIIFPAKVGSVGFAVYFAKLTLPYNNAPTDLKATPRTLENARYRVTLNDAGDIASIYDKQSSRELLSAPARLAFLNENPDKFPAWNMDWADRQKPPRAYAGGPAKIEIVENGPVRVALRVTRSAQGSTIAQTIRLAAGDAGNRVEIANTIDWLSKGCSLKAAFPLADSNPRATYNWDLGKIERGNNDGKKYEVPTHAWLDLTDAGGAHGVSILTGAKYGSDKPDDHTLRLTLLYTPEVDRQKQYEEQRWQDWGRHDFTYGIYAHAGDWRKGGADWQAQRMEQPLLAFTTAAHDGPLGRAFSLLQVISPASAAATTTAATDPAAAIAIRAIKLAENSDRVIVRLQELNGAPQTGIALATNAATLANIEELNGLEKPLGDQPLASGNSAIRNPHSAFAKYQLRTLALTLDAPRAKLPAAVSTPVELPCNINAFGHRASSANSDSSNNSNANTNATANGDFDGAGATLPAEQMPDTITTEGITFKIAPHAKDQRQPNAVRCEGQTITLPAGNHNRLYILAAAVKGDTTGEFAIVGATTTTATLRIQNWTGDNGYIGSWENRVFKGEVEELTYSVDNALDHIDTGYIKRAPLAWWSDHHYLRDGATAFYSYAYLYKYALDLPANATADAAPAGARTLTLPKNPNIRILAITLAQDPAAPTQPAQPLYDDFTNRPPTIIPPGWATVADTPKAPAPKAAKGKGKKKN